MEEAGARREGAGARREGAGARRDGAGGKEGAEARREQEERIENRNEFCQFVCYYECKQKCGRSDPEYSQKWGMPGKTYHMRGWCPSTNMYVLN